eukprot:Clim_evm72s22 gene=Clim_evmTU72s22
MEQSKTANGTLVGPGDMMKFQASLPKLPIPDLDEVCDKLLLSLKPLLSYEDYREYSVILEDFRRGDGPKLHKLLKEFDETVDNWLEDIWIKIAYLSYREPNVINSNAFFEFDDTEGMSQAAAGALFTDRILQFAEMIRTENVPVPLMGGKPTDMSQYKRIVRAQRIPKYGCDEIYIPEWDESRHLAVLCNNHIYTLPVVFEDGSHLNRRDLERQFNNIIEDANSKGPGEGVGALTALGRDEWAEVHATLLRDRTNTASLKAIDNALFVVTLDRTYPHTHSEVMALCGHGGGSGRDGQNRWFDKCIQVHVAKNGRMGLQLEHTMADGMQLAELVLYSMKPTAKLDNRFPDRQVLDTPKKLDWNLSLFHTEAIDRARVFHDANCANLRFESFIFKDYGKEFLKGVKVSPDAYFQMAMQLAYYRLHNEIPATYETAATMRFYHGRTETIRSASIWSREFCVSMDNERITPENKVQLLREAILAHSKYTREAGQGHGCDRPMLGMRIMAQRNGIRPHKAFTHAAFARGSTFQLSSSQVPMNAGFGPVCADGYGICYQVRPHDIRINISSFVNSQKTDLGRMQSSLRGALKSMSMLFNVVKAKV